MNQIEQLVADIRNKLTPFWTVVSRIKVGETNDLLFDNAVDIAEEDKENIINSLEQIVELSQATTSVYNETLNKALNQLDALDVHHWLDMEISVGACHAEEDELIEKLKVSLQELKSQIPAVNLKWKNIPEMPSELTIPSIGLTFRNEVSYIHSTHDIIANQITHYISIVDLLQLEKE